MIHYTPEQRMLFEQDPESWVEDDVQDSDRRVSGGQIYRHTLLGHRIQLTEDPGWKTWVEFLEDGLSSREIFVFTPSGENLAWFQLPENHTYSKGFPGLMERLRDTFSPFHRQLLDNFMDDLLHDFIQANEADEIEVTIDPHPDRPTTMTLHHHWRSDLPVVAARPTELLDRLLSIPIGYDMNGTGPSLFSGIRQRFFLQVPGSSHARMDIISRVQDRCPPA